MRLGAVLVGHGSKAPEALDTLKKLAGSMRRRLNGSLVLAFASLQFNEPTLTQAVEKLIEENVEKIIVLPLFLYAGNHLKDDIPDEIDRIKKAHTGVEFVFAQSIGNDPRIVEILQANLYGVIENHVDIREHIRQPRDIEDVSFRLIEEELADYGLSDSEKEVVARIVHATADVSLAADVLIKGSAIPSGVGALASGARIITDVRMVKSGISRKLAGRLGLEIVCCLDAPGVDELALKDGTTRSAAGMRACAKTADGGLIVVGNAPTALFEVCRMIEHGEVDPALVVGVPVGFVGAAESKRYLASLDVPSIIVRGARGGSPIAAAAVNALLKLATEK